MTLELCNSQPIRTKPNICIYLESIRVALSYQVQKDLISFKHSSVTTMLNELDRKSLEKQRDDSILVMFHKIINQYVDIPYDHILHKVPSTTRSSSRKYLHLPSRIDSYMQSFFPRAIRLWNHLPDYLVETDNVDTFKSLLL